MSPRSVLSLCHLHLYKTGQNSSPHWRPRSLQVFQQEVCKIRPCCTASHKNRNFLVDIQNATVSFMTSHFSQLTTCPQNTSLERGLATWPLDMTSQHDLRTMTTIHDRGRWLWKMTVEDDCGRWQWSMTSDRGLGPWPQTMTWEHDLGNMNSQHELRAQVQCLKC